MGGAPVLQVQNPEPPPIPPRWRSWGEPVQQQRDPFLSIGQFSPDRRTRVVHEMWGREGEEMCLHWSETQQSHPVIKTINTRNVRRVWLAGNNDNCCKFQSRDLLQRKVDPACDSCLIRKTMQQKAAQTKQWQNPRHFSQL